MPVDDTPDPTRGSILVVEDELYSTNVITRALKGLGAADVTVAANGVEALAHIDAAETPPDLLFVDIVMPEMGGVELLRTLAERGFGGAVVIISGTGEANMNALKRVADFRGVNVLCTIAKPAKASTLRDAILQALDG